MLVVSPESASPEILSLIPRSRSQWVGRLQRSKGVNGRKAPHPQATCETDGCRVHPTLGHGFVFVTGASINDRAVLDIIDTVKVRSILFCECESSNVKLLGLVHRPRRHHRVPSSLHLVQ